MRWTTFFFVIAPWSEVFVVPRENVLWRSGRWVLSLVIIVIFIPNSLFYWLLWVIFAMITVY